MTSAARRLAELRKLTGAHGETAALAADLAQLLIETVRFGPET